jgi:PAS domain S-box-containing protein
MRDTEMGRTPSNRILGELALELSATPAGEFLEHYVESASRILECDFFFVGRMNVANQRMRSICAASKGAMVDPFCYSLADTPCAEVMGREVCVYPDRVAELFDKDEMLAEMGMRAYVGVPLFDGDLPVGIIVALFKDALTDTDSVVGAIEYFSRRVSVNMLAREKDERQRLALEGASDGIWDWDVTTGQIYMSGRLRQLLGHERKGCMVSSEVMAETLHPDDLERVRQARQANWETGARYDLTYRMLAANGQYRWFRSRGDSVRGSLDEPVRMIGSMTDIHDLVEARQQATEASRAKSKFLATMSHEIRTPLNGVLGMASLLQSTELEVSQANMVRLIEESGRSLLDILNDILDIANIESGRFEIEDSEFNPARLAETLAGPFRLKALEKDLRFHVEIDPVARRDLEGDPARIRQILANMLSNAVKFTERGEIRLRCLMAQNETGEDQVRFEVADTGCGIEEDLQPRIFMPFIQAEPLMTRKVGGTGLGLAIGKKLAELMGGDIEVESAPGAGSVFVLALPVRAIEQAAPSEEAPPFDQSSTARSASSPN